MMRAQVLRERDLYLIHEIDSFRYHISPLLRFPQSGLGFQCLRLWLIFLISFHLGLHQAPLEFRRPRYHFFHFS